MAQLKQKDIDPHNKQYVHKKCLSEYYSGTKQKRLQIPPNQILWTIKWDDYNPFDYTDPSVLKNKGPDPNEKDIISGKANLQWNSLDNKIDRKSHMGNYDIVDGLPRNPIGRTGLKGRGFLWRWGPNHAADPIVTRWKRNNQGDIVKKNGLPILEFVAIQRKDNGEWAIPGGMIEPGDTVSGTLKKEFGEEALNSLEANDEKKQDISEKINKLFQHGELIYKGYVDDPRNTDNSWMETVAMNFHDENGESVAQLELQAGDDAGSVQWKEITKDLVLYASHSDLIQQVVKKKNAYW